MRVAMRAAMACKGAIGLALGIGLTAAAGQAAPGHQAAAYSHEAPVQIERAAPFVALELPVAVLGASRRLDRADLRLEDASGQPLPFAWLPPRARPQSGPPPERQAQVALYPWPRSTQPDAVPQSVRVVTRGARIEVLARPHAAGTPAPGTSLQGWLIDLGPRAEGAEPPRALQLDWPAATPPFTAAYRLSSSDDLRSWRDAGTGHLLALAAASGVPAASANTGPGGALALSRVSLPADIGRFIRLSWVESAGAPMLTAARAGWPLSVAPVDDHPLVLTLKPAVAPAATAANVLPPARDRAARAGGSAEPDAAEAARRARSLWVDLGAALELRRVSVRFAGGNRVVPVTVQWRAGPDEAWRDAATTVLYRLERPGAEADVPPALVLMGLARELRFVPDVRAAALAGVEASVVVEAVRPQLVFVPQGQPPLRLRVGAALAEPGGVPLATLVPKLDDERARFGRATVGALQADATVQAAQERERFWARWRPWALWAVLLIGVAALGTMVWRLARGSR